MNTPTTIAEIATAARTVITKALTVERFDGDARAAGDAVHVGYEDGADVLLVDGTLPEFAEAMAARLPERFAVAIGTTATVLDRQAFRAGTRYRVRVRFSRRSPEEAACPCP